MKKIVLSALVALTASALPGNALADIMWYKLKASCACMADSANDFHLAIDAYSVDNITILNDPCPGCTDVVISVSGQGTGIIEIDFNWIGDYVIAGAGLELALSTTTPLMHAEGYWTISGQFVSHSYIQFEWLPDSPLPSLSRYGLFAAALVMTLTGILICRRRRAAAAVRSR